MEEENNLDLDLDLDNLDLDNLDLDLGGLDLGKIPDDEKIHTLEETSKEKTPAKIEGSAKLFVVSFDVINSNLCNVIARGDSPERYTLTRTQTTRLNEAVEIYLQSVDFQTSPAFALMLCVVTICVSQYSLALSDRKKNNVTDKKPIQKNIKFEKEEEEDLDFSEKNNGRGKFFLTKSKQYVYDITGVRNKNAVLKQRLPENQPSDFFLKILEEKINEGLDMNEAIKKSGVIIRRLQNEE